MTVVVTSLMAPSTDHLVRGLVGHLDRNGFDSLWLGGSWKERLGAVSDGRVDVAWICGLLHVRRDTSRLPFRAVAAPVSSRPGWSGAPVYFGDLVTGPSTTAATLADLQGSTFAFNEAASLSGHGMMTDRLAALGTDLNFFADTVRTGSHAASIRSVAEGGADCALIDSILVDHVGLPHGLTVIESLGPYPAPPFVIVDSAPELTAAIRAHPWLTPVAESTYDPLRRTHIRSPAAG